MKRIWLLLLVVWGLGFAFPQAIAAQSDTENFLTKLKTTYSVQLDGTTRVEHQFSIQNLKPTFYVSKYGLNLNSNEIEQVKVYDGNKEIPVEVTTNGSHSSINISFPDQLLGEKKTRNFSVTFLDKSIAQITGKVLEVSIPHLTDADQYNEYSVSLITPLQFGNPSRANLTDYKHSLTGNGIQLDFTNVKNTGISVIYGDAQFYTLQLRYYLENPHDQLATTQIAFPPDASHQVIAYEAIDPLPDEMKVDADGNWIGTYSLQPHEAKSVVAIAKVKVTLEPNALLQTTADEKPLIAKQEYWEVDHRTIRDLSGQYQTPDAIYAFVTDTLTYTKSDLSADLERLGALTSLSQPEQATCQEYTDLFIALARANHIPSRRIAGYAYSQNEKLRPLGLVNDILHSWPEFYNTQTQRWQPIDPTWGDTTGGVDYFNNFDLNHIVFVINGKSSTLPLPVGAYKPEDVESKDVEVSFAQDFPTVNPEFTVTAKPRTVSSLELPGWSTIEITNLTGRAWYNVNAIFLSQDTSVQINAAQETLNVILPFQTLRIPVQVYKTSGVDIGKTAVTVQLSSQEIHDQTYSLELTSLPSAFKDVKDPFVLVGVVVGGGLVAIAAGSLLLRRRKR